MNLPVPEDLDLGVLQATDFHRIAVAYGLSHEHVNLGVFALPREVKPAEYVTLRRQRREAPTKDVC